MFLFLLLTDLVLLEKQLLFSQSIQLFLLRILLLFALLLQEKLFHLTLMLFLKFFEALGSNTLGFFFNFLFFSLFTRLLLFLGLSSNRRAHVGATSNVATCDVPLIDGLLDLIFDIVHAQVHLKKVRNGIFLHNQ
jgi:hypothetical protein